MIHGVTEAVMASLAEPHWHAVSVKPQEVDAIADVKQVICQVIIISSLSLDQVVRSK